MTIVAEAVRSPYKGLSAFDDSDLDALLFFGRERETEIVVANALASRLTVLYGPSGVGKSSLLRAGVVHALRRLSSTEDIAVAYVSSWSGDPVEAIEEAVRGALSDAFGGDPGDAPGDLADRLEAWTAALGSEVCLVLDQFEELFLYHAEGGLVDALPEIVTRPGLRVNVVLGIRDDELAQLDVFKAHIPGLFSNYLRLDLLDREEARAAILGPLERYNELEGSDVEIEPELVEAVLGEVAAGRIDPGRVGRGSVGEEDRTRIETPYLQLVLQRLWEVERERRSEALRLATLAQLGGAQRIVEDHLDRAMAALTPPQRDVAAGMFDHLVTPSGAKIAHGVGDLASFAHVDTSQLEPVLQSLAHERILRPTGEIGQSGDRYEIYHDVLAGAVLAWRAQHEADAALQRERVESRRRQRRLAAIAVISFAAFALMAALTIYAYAQQSKATRQTAIAREQRANALAAKKVSERATVRAVHARNEVQRQKLRYQRLYNANVAIAAAERRQRERADATAAKIGEQNTELAQQKSQLQQANTNLQAERQAALQSATLEKLSAVKAKQATLVAQSKTREARAAQSRIVANEWLYRSLAQLAIDPVQSVADALQSTRTAAVPAAENVLRTALLANHLLAELDAGGPAQAAAYSPDSSLIAVADAPGRLRIFGVPSGKLITSIETSAPLHSVAWSPDGREVAAGARNGVIRVWNVATHSLVWVGQQGGSVVSLAYSPDGRTLASAGDKTAKLWNAASGEPAGTLVHDRAIRTVAFNTDGTLVLTVSNDTSARVWDTATGTPVATLPQKGEITAAAFGPGDQVVTGSRDSKAVIWNGRTGAVKWTLEGHTAQISAVAFSPVGDKVATGSIDGTVRVWSASTGGLLDLRLMSSPVVAVSFARDGQSVVAADSTGRAVTFGPAQLQVELRGQRGTMRDAMFAPDGRSVATLAGSTVRLWEPYGEPQLRGIHKGPGAASSVVFDPTGRLLASGGADGTVVVQRAHGGPLRTLTIGAPVMSLGWAKNGVLMVAAKDGTVHLRPNGGTDDTQTIAHGSTLLGAALRSDGAVVATAGTDGFVRLWDTRSGTRLLEIHQPAGLTSVALDPSGKLVAAGVADDVILYDATDGSRISVLGGHTDLVTGVAFSPSGTLLASSSRDHDARVWDVRKLRLVKILSRHTSTVSGVAFSGDGRWLATAGPLKAGVWAPGASDLPGSFMFFVRGNQTPIASVAFAPHGWELATAARDGSIRVYDCVLCGRLPNLESYARAQLKQLLR